MTCSLENNRVRPTTSFNWNDFNPIRQQTYREIESRGTKTSDKETRCQGKILKWNDDHARLPQVVREKTSEKQAAPTGIQPV